MLEHLGAWVLRLTGAAMLSSAAVLLTPKTPAKRAVLLGCGLLTVMALLSIVPGYQTAPGKLLPGDYYGEAERMTAEYLSEAENETKAVIEERAEAYIMDKAGIFGAGVTSVLVDAEKGDGGWFLRHVRVTCRGPEGAEELSRCISGELGISKEEQEWIFLE
ncbi:MAG: hypothetical protein IKR21_03865 [Oscillospiraceae bacterium]|nr:hypothetical protein [Oscillospiraceae bacterium]